MMNLPLDYVWTGQTAAVQLFKAFSPTPSCGHITADEEKPLMGWVCGFNVCTELHPSRTYSVDCGPISLHI